jgi:hypothetical protein
MQNYNKELKKIWDSDNLRGFKFKFKLGNSV